MDELIHLRITSRTRIPVCWTRNGPLPVDHLTDDISRVSCSDCIEVEGTDHDSDPGQQ